MLRDLSSEVHSLGIILDTFPFLVTYQSPSLYLPPDRHPLMSLPKPSFITSGLDYCTVMDSCLFVQKHLRRAPERPELCLCCQSPHTHTHSPGSTSPSHGFTVTSSQLTKTIDSLSDPKRKKNGIKLKKNSQYLLAKRAKCESKNWQKFGKHVVNVTKYNQDRFHRAKTERFNLEKCYLL